MIKYLLKHKWIIFKACIRRKHYKNALKQIVVWRILIKYGKIDSYLHTYLYCDYPFIIEDFIADRKSDILSGQSGSSRWLCCSEITVVKTLLEDGSIKESLEYKYESFNI